MKMDAIIKPYPQKGLELVRKDIPVLKSGEALVKIIKTAICGTDIHIYEWEDWARANIKPPITIGHEFVGKIVELKDAHNNVFKVGDLVSAEGHLVCGKCRNCRAGKRHLCRETKGIGVNIDGVFAEYAAIPISNLWLCEEEIEKNIYSMFDPFGNAVHTALKYNTVGEDVLITGAGPIGIMAAAVCRHSGAKNIVITDISSYRLNLALKINPDITAVNVLETSIKDVQISLGMREGFDIGLEMSGSSSAFNEMIENMITGGRIALLGIQGADTKIDWNKVIFKSLNIKGIYGREMFETWHLMTQIVKCGVNISGIITHEMDYKDFEKAIQIACSGKSGKIILNW